MPTRVAAKTKLDPRAFEATLKGLVQDLARRRYSEALIEHTRRSSALLFAYLCSQRMRDLPAVTDAHVTAYARHLAKVPFRPRHALLDLHPALAALLHPEALPLPRGTRRDPPQPRDLELPSWRRLPRAVLHQEQARRLMAHPGHHSSRGKRRRAILELLYGTGIRVGECEWLDLSDVNLGQGVLFIRDGKGKRDRVVPLLGRAADALDLYLREARPALLKDPSEGALLLTRHGTRLRKKVIQYRGSARRIPSTTGTRTSSILSAGTGTPTRETTPCGTWTRTGVRLP